MVNCMVSKTDTNLIVFINDTYRGIDNNGECKSSTKICCRVMYRFLVIIFSYLRLVKCRIELRVTERF